MKKLLAVLMAAAIALPLVSCGILSGLKELGDTLDGIGGDGNFKYDQEYISKNLGDYWMVCKVTTYSEGKTTTGVVEQIRTDAGYFIKHDESDEGSLFIRKGEEYEIYTLGDGGVYEGTGAMLPAETIDSYAMGAMYYLSFATTMAGIGKESGTKTVAGRGCDVFTVNLVVYKQSIAVDKATGVCLESISEWSAGGKKEGVDFVCTKFETSGVKLPNYK